MNQPLNSAEQRRDRDRNDKGERIAEPGCATPNGLRKISGASAPAIAISEPTERSMPPVEMTSVMPTETMTIVATCVRLTFSVCQLAKFGVTAKLNASSTRSAVSAA